MKEELSETIFESIKGIKRAEPNPFLLTRILAKIETRQPAQLTRSQVRIAMVCCLALVIINLFIVVRHRAVNNESSVYSLNNHHYQLY